ncbi:MAG TPA: methyltransferase domain-containing protein [Solirubrobacteraceae bacterium]|nr:methyltransferase domain-containing protein [Solirubrobacteraceae bacterium]
MPGDADPRSYGATFDTVAAEYDRRRPTYPDELIERAFELGGLVAGDRVLEIGCGTGQLTRSLVARGLHVTAVDPGANLIELARRGLDGPGRVEFVNGRYEDISVEGEFAAVFSASAFHWVDPDVSWAKVAAALTPGGLLALITHCGLRHELVDTDDEALIAAVTDVAPEVAAALPPLRDLETILSGVDDRRENVSDVWAWLGHRPLARPYAGPLFGEVEIATAPRVTEQTADELNALLATTSLYPRLAPAQREALERGHREIEQRVGRPIRAGMAAVLVTARRL